MADSNVMKANKRYFLGQRHIVTFFGFLNCFLINTNRLVLGVSVVTMVKHRQTNETSKWNKSEISCPTSAAPSKPVNVPNGITTPAIFKMLSNWIPRAERGTLNSLAVCGFWAGIAIGGLVTGWICDIPGLGWPAAFYIWATFYTMEKDIYFYSRLCLFLWIIRPLLGN
ncbi:unnamed protein product, partial [Larinioides sclopetarius]